MSEQPVRAFRCTIDGIPEKAVVFAESAGRARYRTYLSAQDVGLVASITEVRVRRAPEYDARRPRLDVKRPKCWSEDFVRDYGADE